jgi:hypothetical protein
MIEDVMQGSLPSFIYSVKVSDMSQGSNPFRITSIRSLPDADLTEALEGLPEEDKHRLQGKHIVRVHFWLNFDRSYRVSRTSKSHLHTELNQVVKPRGAKRIMLSQFYKFSFHAPFQLALSVFSSNFSWDYRVSGVKEFVSAP